MPRVYEKIIQYIDEHINEEITVSDIAKFAGYSRQHLYTFFQANSDVPVMEYVRRRKLTAAAGELYSDKKMYDIALDYGYETPAGFYKAFQSIFGCSPSDYKNNMRRSRRSNRFMRRNTIEELTNEIKLDPNNAELYVQRGFMYWNYFSTNENELDKALADFSKAVEIDPNQASGYRGLAHVHKHMRRFDKSIEAFSKAIEIDPNNASAYIERAIIYQDLGQYNKAMEGYEKVMKLESDASDFLVIAYRRRAECYTKLGQHDKALQDLDKAVEFAKETNYPWQIYESRGNVYEALGQHDKALEDYEKAASFDTPLPWPYETLAWRYTRAGRYDEAAKMLDKAVSKNPTGIWTLGARVYSFLHAKRYDDVVKYASEAIEIAAELDLSIYRGWAYGFDEPLAHLRLYRDRALAYEALGEHDKAIADYEKVLELVPAAGFEDSEFEQVRERLEKLRKNG